MLEGGITTAFVIDDYRTHIPGLQLAANHHGWHFALAEIGQEIDIYEQPIRDDDKPFDPPLQQHLEISFEAPALVMHISQHRKICGLVQ